MRVLETSLQIFNQNFNRFCKNKNKNCSLYFQPEKPTGTLKEQLTAITPTLEQLWQQKEERIKQFLDVQVQIQRICGEISRKLQLNEPTAPKVDDQDLSLKKFDEFHLQFQELQREKVIFLSSFAPYAF